MKNLLSSNADAKTVKGLKLGFLTGILYMSPSDISGYQVCPSAKLAGCETACLYTAGRGAMSTVQKARIAKTKRFFEEREEFMADLIYSIKALQRKAQRMGLTPLVRLNGTSDIAYENVRYQGLNIFEHFPTLAFYDYTKLPTRKNIPANYDLTFSYSGVKSFAPLVAKANANSALSRIAVVFDKAENIPKTFMFTDVIGGDNSDIRHTEPRGVVVALYAKGKARQDRTGFVVRK
jgi:hypothetical protein